MREREREKTLIFQGLLTRGYECEWLQPLGSDVCFNLLLQGRQARAAGLQQQQHEQHHVPERHPEQHPQ